MSILDLAQAVGIGPVAMSNIERGVRSPLPATLRAISSALGCSIAYLGRYEGLPEDTLGQRIRKARMYHGLSLPEAAKQLGVNVRTLWAWEVGQRKPTRSRLSTLAEFLAVLDRPSGLNGAPTTAARPGGGAGGSRDGPGQTGNMPG